MFFLGTLSIQCKIRCDRPSDTWWSTGQSNHQPVLLATPGLFQHL